MNTYLIYVLTDESGIPFYVGKTNNAPRRKRRHINDALSGHNRYVCNKIRKIFDQGGSVTLKPIEVGLTNLEACKREIFYIADFKKKGIKLCNLTRGGDGMDSKSAKIANSKRKKTSHSEETKKKMSAAKRGVPFSYKHKKALSAAWKRTPEQMDQQAKKASETSRGKINIGLFRCTDANGKVYETKNGLKEFCREHSLSSPNMIKVANGERKHHKGWLCERMQT